MYVLKVLHILTKWRAEDFSIPGVFTFSPRETHENFFSAPGKFLSASAIFSLRKFHEVFAL